MSMAAAKPFLTAQWRQLAMLNYEIDPAVLAPYVPAGTEIDFFDGNTFVSVVGFMFLDTRVLGVPIPFHRDFEEINLRFYVRRETESEVRRGVVFVREIVPKLAIALVARWVYHENYVALPTRRCIEGADGEPPTRVGYSWRLGSSWQSVSVTPVGDLRELESGAEEEFIAEHYWGYTKRRDGRTSEYRVDHPTWKVRSVRDAKLECDVANQYGSEFASFVTGKPSSAFLAEGSEVVVRRGSTIESTR